MTKLTTTIPDKSSIALSKDLPLKKRQWLVYENYKNSPLLKRTSRKGNSLDVRRPKRVRFGGCTTNILPIRTSKDVENAWYRDSEYMGFELERRRTVHAFNHVNGELALLNPTEFTVAGLEQQLSRQQMISRKIQIRQHCELVLQTQHFQRCIGNHDPEAIRSISELFSKQSSKRAALRGILSQTLDN
jgi:hypothetical protein